MALVEWGTGLDTLVWAEETSEARVLKRWRQTVEGGRDGVRNRARGCWTGNGHALEGTEVHGKGLGFILSFMDPFKGELVRIRFIFLKGCFVACGEQSPGVKTGIARSK